MEMGQWKIIIFFPLPYLCIVVVEVVYDVYLFMGEDVAISYNSLTRRPMRGVLQTFEAYKC